MYDGYSALDLTGPSMVFSSVGRFDFALEYDIFYASVSGGRIDAFGGPPIETQKLADMTVDLDTTILVVGSEARGTNAAVNNPVLIGWLQDAANGSERIGSVCTGAFILAEAGLLVGKRAATHWRACSSLSLKSPGTDVDQDALFVRDANIWTSAGVTAGIDMALAMVEQDVGRPLTDQIARNLVVYLRRSGYQSQYSDILSAQTRAGDVFGPLAEWIIANLATKITIEQMASRMAMSDRTFHRRLKQLTGKTPAAFLTGIRLDHARHLLVNDMKIAQIAHLCGYSSETVFRGAFIRQFGITPSEYRRIYQAGA